MELNVMKRIPWRKGEVPSPVSTASPTTVLRIVSRHEGFHFYQGPDDPTGRIAVSLEEFAEKLKHVDVRSINYHYKRRDFSKWVQNVLSDHKLATKLSRIQRDSHGEKLRTKLLRLVQNRLSELKGP
jgi:hypothetical protein